MKKDYFVCRDVGNNSTFITANVKRAERDGVIKLHQGLSKKEAKDKFKDYVL